MSTKTIDALTFLFFAGTFFVGGAALKWQIDNWYYDRQGKMQVCLQELQELPRNQVCILEMNYKIVHRNTTEGKIVHEPTTNN